MVALILLQHSAAPPSPIIGAVIVFLGFAFLVTPQRFLPGIKAANADRSHPKLFGVYLIFFGLFLLALYVQKSGGHKEAVLAGYVIYLFLLAVVVFMTFAFLAVGVVFIRYPDDYTSRLWKLHLSSIKWQQEPSTPRRRFALRIVGILFVAGGSFLAYFLFSILLRIL